MTENAKNPTAQNTIQDPPEYNTEKQGSDWLGGPQNGDETPGEYGNEHRFNETPSEAEKTLQEKPSSDISGPTGSGK